MKRFLFNNFNLKKILTYAFVTIALVVSTNLADVQPAHAGVLNALFGTDMQNFVYNVFTGDNIQGTGVVLPPPTLPQQSDYSNTTDYNNAMAAYNRAVQVRNDQIKANANPTNGATPIFTCDTTATCISWGFQWIFEKIGNLILSLMGLLLWGAGQLLNMSIILSVTAMQSTISNLPYIGAVWGVLRDFVNLFFIFILLYTSINVIIGQGTGNKAPGKVIPTLILVAIFINFSMFITEALIDASNVITYGFYSQIAGVNTASQNYSGASTTSGSNPGGLSGAIMQNLNLQKLYEINKQQGTFSLFSYMAGTLGGALFILIAAWVFLAMAILLLIRFVYLIFLIMFSPVMFLGYLGVDKLGQVSKMWWDTLMEQLIFAPAMMIMLWIAVNITNGSAQLASGASSNYPLIAIIFNYIVMIIFMLLVLVIAKKAGASGSKFATKWAGKATTGAVASIGRNTLGRYGYNRAQDRGLQARAAAGGFGGMMAKAQLTTFNKMGSSSYNALSPIGKTRLASEMGMEKLTKEDKLGYGKRTELQIKEERAKNGKLKATDEEQNMVNKAIVDAKEINTKKVAEYDTKLAEQEEAVKRLEALRNNAARVYPEGYRERTEAEKNYNKEKTKRDEMVKAKEKALKDGLREELATMGEIRPGLKSAMEITGIKDGDKVIEESAREKHALNVEGKGGSVSKAFTDAVNKIAPPASKTALPMNAKEKATRKLQDMIRGATKVAHNKDVADKVRKDIKDGKVFSKDKDAFAEIKERLEKAEKIEKEAAEKESSSGGEKPAGGGGDGGGAKK